LGSPFLCIDFEREISSPKSRDGLEMAAVLYQRCLLPCVLKGELSKLLFHLCSHKDKEGYMIKGAAGYGKEKKGKNLIFFLKTALCCSFEPLMYFTFWIIP